MSFNPKDKIAKRAAKEIRQGQVINLGIGIPTMIPQFIQDNMDLTIHSENGVLGVGKNSDLESVDRNLIDAGATYITTVSGASFLDSAMSFALIRGGRLDLSFLGALEISEKGDLANWIIPGKFAPGIGGGMELAQKAKRVVITTTHVAKNGSAKILGNCTLPLTARSCVNTIITELAVIEVSKDGLLLKEIAKETDLETVIKHTGAPLIVAKELKTF